MSVLRPPSNADVSLSARSRIRRSDGAANSAQRRLTASPMASSPAIKSRLALSLAPDAVEAFTLEDSGRAHSLALPDLAHDRVEPIALLRSLAREAIPALDRRGVPGVEARGLEPELLESFALVADAAHRTSPLGLRGAEARVDLREIADRGFT